MNTDSFELLTAAISDRGLSDKRPVNEDSYLSLPEHGIFAVADGVGGAMGGDVASQMAVEILGEAFSNYSGTVDPEEIMTVAIDRANLAINQMAGELPQLASMASTIAALHLDGNIATIGHVGDSRVYRISKDGDLSRETADHSVVEEEVRAGRMSPEQAANHPSRNVISRAVGAELSVDIDIKTIAVEPGTTFLLCSDGITRHVTDDELAALLTSGMSVEMVCEQLREMCYSRGAEDNLTAVVVKIPVNVDLAYGLPTIAPTEHAISSGNEEETVASAREAAAESETRPELMFDDTLRQDSGPTSPQADLIEPSATADAVSPDHTDEADDEAYLMADEPLAEMLDDGQVFDGFDDASNEASASAQNDQVEYESSKVIVPAATVETIATGNRSDSEFSMFGSNPNTEVVSSSPTASVGRSILRSFFYLILGAALGASAFYFWTVYNKPEPVQMVPVEDLTPKTSNIPASSLEELRWNIDKDPEAYLQQRSGTPQDPTDHYLMGRALFLVNKLWEAESQFKIVESQRDKITPTQSQISILSDIAMMRAIINSGPADVRFKADYAKTKGVGAIDSNTAVSNSNTSSNTGSNTNSTLVP